MEAWAPTTARALVQDTWTDGEFVVEPFTDRCADLWLRGHHAVIGVSAGNGYFTQERIAAVLRWAVGRFERVDVVTAHVEMVARTYLGIGYGERHARQRAHKDVRNMANRVGGALESVGAGRERIRLREISDVFGSERYAQVSADIAQSRRECAGFREVCARLVREVLCGRMPAGWEPGADQIAAGMGYLDMELPWFVDTPGMLRVEESVFVYCATPAFVPWLYGPGAVLPTSPGQGFVCLRPLQQAA